MGRSSAVKHESFVTATTSTAHGRDDRYELLLRTISRFICSWSVRCQSSMSAGVRLLDFCECLQRAFVERGEF